MNNIIKPYAVYNSFSLESEAQRDWKWTLHNCKGRKHGCKNPQQLTQQSKFRSTLRGPFTILQWGLSQACKNSSKYANLWKWHTILTEWEQKYMTTSIDAEKILVQVQNTLTIKFSTS